jgi:hypothetical protein
VTFIRSRSGLSNLHLFVGADAIVFLEGGRGYSLADVEAGKFDNYSPDIRFWRSIFNLYLPRKKYQFRSIGSKTTLLTIANAIKEKKIRNVIVAMDNDHDSLNRLLVKSENVIYTCGYSWENDVWNNHTILDTFRDLVGLSTFDDNNIKGQIDGSLNEFSKNIKLAVRLDIVLSQYGGSFFDRAAPARYVSLTSRGRPSVNVGQIKTQLGIEKKTRKFSIMRAHSFNYDPIVNCFGHLVFEFCYNLINFLIKTVTSLPRIAKEYVNCVGVEKFILGIQHGFFTETKAHYDSVFSRITA